jgi:ubiquinone/menaquinone biosynthesis C-methylase UbiE
VAGKLPGDVQVQTILDAGCGTGLFTIGLALTDSSRRLVGLDTSAGMLAVARNQADRLRLANVSFGQGDVLALPFDDATFDAVVAGGLFPNLNDPADALRELRRILKPEGRILIVEFDRTSMSLAVRLFFRTMILGQRAVSTLVPRFRFARRWNTRASTIDCDVFRRDLRRAGFVEREVGLRASHVFFDYAKARPT